MRLWYSAHKYLGQRQRPKLNTTSVWTRVLCILALFTLFTLCTLSTSAYCHLMSAGVGTVNIRQEDALVLIGVAASSLRDVDDNHDGLLQPDEIQKHHDNILQQIRSGFTLTIDGIQAQVVEEYLLVSVHVDNNKSTPQIEWWSRLVFTPPLSHASPCVVLQLDWFMPEKTADEPAGYGIQISRNAVNELGQLTKSQSTHRFHCVLNDMPKH